MKQTFYLTALGAAFLSAALISDVSDCIGAPPSQGNHSRPGGASPRPGGAPSRPSGTPRPGGSPRPSGSPSRPGGSSHPSGSPQHAAPSRQSSPRPSGGHVNPQPRPSGQHNPSNGNNGGRVVRRVTSNTLTGEVIRDEYFGATSPIHRDRPEPFDRPGIGPGYHPGGYPGHNPPPPPPPRPYYPYYPNTLYPLPAYPPPPPGFPPPPAFWPGFIYNGLPILINANVNVIPNYPNIQQLGLFAVYDSYGNRSGSLLVYYNPLNSKLGGYFNPVGTKYTRSVQGLVSMVNGVQTAMFTVNDQFKTECAVPFSDLLAGASASGTMLTPSQVLGGEPEAAAFSLQRLK